MEGATAAADPMTSLDHPHLGPDQPATVDASSDVADREPTAFAQQPAAEPTNADRPDPIDTPSDVADREPTAFAEQPTAEPTSPDEPTAGSAPPAAQTPTEILPHRVVEAILFASDTPLAAPRIAEVLGVGTAREVRQHIAGLNEEYARLGLSFRIEEIAGGYQMLTLPAYNTWLAKLLRARQETKVSQAALETLAIVAYKQPSTRADVEAIRGVAAGEMLNRLREMNLVKIVGRAEDLGRPLLYGTTRKFLEAFGLPSLADLPQVEIFGKAAAAIRELPAQSEPPPTPVGDHAEPPSSAAGDHPEPSSTAAGHPQHEQPDVDTPADETGDSPVELPQPPAATDPTSVEAVVNGDPAGSAIADQPADTDVPSLSLVDAPDDVLEPAPHDDVAPTSAP